MTIAGEAGPRGPTDAADQLTERIGGTLWGRVVEELFSNSAHFPLANILFEMLGGGVLGYLAEPDFYAICVAALVQAYVLGRGEFRGRRPAFLGNLVGPAVYTVIEVLFDGLEFFAGPHHIAYWVFGLVIGGLQLLRGHGSGGWRDVLLVVENVVRALILVTLYWIFEAQDDPTYATLSGFVSDPSHIFVSLAAPGLGVLLGLAGTAHLRRVLTLHRTAGRLRDFSEWSMGRNLVARAVADPNVLKLKRESRAVLFMDIRGFTRWTEPRPPEDVVAMLDAYFTAAESVWTRYDPIIARLIADEVMLVLPDFPTGLRVAEDLRRETLKALDPFGLSAGSGLNAGPLMEGMIGSPDIRSYDIIGDTANTAARLCSAAAQGEVLVPAALAETAAALADFGPVRSIEAKGKREPLAVCPLERLIG